jgi:hypothetical protein
MWHEHEQRWPREQRSPSDLRRPGDPTGSWRGDGDRYLSPEQNEQANRLIAELRQPEPSITADLTRIEAENPHGGRLVGVDHRVKGEDRLKEKIADNLRERNAMGLADAVAPINDAVRYTFCFDGEHYLAGFIDLKQRLEVAGNRMLHGRNHWRDNAGYMGVNTSWVTPDGARFELQFHTRESFHAKEQLTHQAYERSRSRTSSWAELRELATFQLIVSAAVPTPDGVPEMGMPR